MSQYKVYNLTPWEQYAPLPNQTEFLLPFALDAEEDLLIYFNEELDPRPSSEYTVEGAVRQTVTEETGTQGKVVFGLAPEGQGVTKITATRLTSKDRLSNFPSGGRFMADDHNFELNRQTMMVKDIELSEGYSPRLQRTDDKIGKLVIPPVVQRANKLSGFDSEGLYALSQSTIEQIDGAVAAQLGEGSVILEKIFEGDGNTTGAPLFVLSGVQVTADVSIIVTVSSALQGADTYSIDTATQPGDTIINFSEAPPLFSKVIARVIGRTEV